MRLVLSVVFAVVLGLSVASPASAAPEPPAQVACAESVKPSECDVDRDRIADVLEVQVCGSATCATGREDKDGDGIPDWVEFRACETATCADASADVDGDGIPDFAERLTCGSLSCSSGREDADNDKIADWIEFVICGDRLCANGSEDYDADGVPDAKQLAACIIAFDITTIPRWYEETWSVTIGSDDRARLDRISGVLLDRGSEIQVIQKWLWAGAAGILTVVGLAGCAAPPTPSFSDMTGNWVHIEDGEEVELSLADDGAFEARGIPSYVFATTYSTDPTPLDVSGVCEQEVRTESYPNYVLCDLDGINTLKSLFVYANGDEWTLAFSVRPAYDATMFEFHRSS